MAARTSMGMPAHFDRWRPVLSRWRLGGAGPGPRGVVFRRRCSVRDRFAGEFVYGFSRLPEETLQLRPIKGDPVLKEEFGPVGRELSQRFFEGIRFPQPGVDELKDL